MLSRLTPTRSPIDEDLTKVRRFLGRLSGYSIVTNYGVLRGIYSDASWPISPIWPQRRVSQNGNIQMCTACAISPIRTGLFQAFAIEMELDPSRQDVDLFQGVDLLGKLMQRVVHFNNDELETA